MSWVVGDPPVGADSFVLLEDNCFIVLEDSSGNILLEESGATWGEGGEPTPSTPWSIGDSDPSTIWTVGD